MIRALHKSYVTIALNSTGALPVAKKRNKIKRRSEIQSLI